MPTYDDYTLKEAIIHITITIMLIGSILGGCAVLNSKLGLENDHPLEEHIEDLIEDKTGIDVDLSGDSKEPCDH